MLQYPSVTTEWLLTQQTDRGQLLLLPLHVRPLALFQKIFPRKISYPKQDRVFKCFVELSCYLPANHDISKSTITQPAYFFRHRLYLSLCAGFVEFRGRHGNRHGSPGRQKNKGSKNSTVMLDDIKAVAYDQLIEQMQKPIAPDFDSIIFKQVDQQVQPTPGLQGDSRF